MEETGNSEKTFLETWTISVLPNTGEKFEVIVNKNCSTAEFCTYLRHHERVPNDEFELFSGERRLLSITHTERLSDYNIRNKSMIVLVVRREILSGGRVLEKDNLNTMDNRAASLDDLRMYRQTKDWLTSEGITITMSPDHLDIVGLDDENPRAIMPCGHSIAQTSLATHCRYELQKGRYQIFCPKCGAVWKLILIREAAALSDKEYSDLERQALMNSFKTDSEGMRPCPNCGTFARPDKDTEKRLVCLNCSDSSSTFEFCWNCLREWKSKTTTSCGNEECDSKIALNDLLANCGTKDVVGVECPSMRACPQCSSLIEHIDKCKHMTCRACGHEFCFICLKNHSWPADSFSKCEAAPRQKAESEEDNRRHIINDRKSAQMGGNGSRLSCPEFRSGGVDQRTATHEMLATCEKKKVNGVRCPSQRACPLCRALIEHTMQKSKHAICARCEYEFCFICLKTHDWATESWDKCKAAPRQKVEDEEDSGRCSIQ